MVDHLKLLAPDRGDPLREALSVVGRSPSVCSFLGLDGLDDGGSCDDGDGLVRRGGGPGAMVGQAEVRLVLGSGVGGAEGPSIGDHLKVLNHLETPELVNPVADIRGNLTTDLSSSTTVCPPPYGHFLDTPVEKIFFLKKSYRLPKTPKSCGFAVFREEKKLHI